MNPSGVKKILACAVVSALALTLTGAMTVSALALVSAEAGSGGLLADVIIKMVHLFIKLILMVA